MISAKLLKQLGGAVWTSPKRDVNMIIVADHIFELSGLELANPDHNYTEIPPKFRGKGFPNLFEFIINEQWFIVTVSDMNGIIDKIEASISIEWHQVRGLNYTKEQMKKQADFAFSVTPYLGEEHYKDDGDYKGYEKYPYLIKFLRYE